MHPRNPYRNAPDFTSLAESYEPLKQYLIPEPHSSRKTIDFKNAEAQRRLTEAIMFRDFGVTLRIPVNRLCPPVPNRINYALWLQDIVNVHQEVLGARVRNVRGIDIGTGATAIYPFLLCKMDKDWSMVATELDDDSYACAEANINANDMQTRIDLRKASAEGTILFPLESAADVFQFSMCNPPFYASAQEVEDLAQEKDFAPNAVCTGTDIEMIYPRGGEVGFVTKMVEESEVFRTRCKWYTSMLGKMSSVISIVEILRERSITNYAITEFVQGQTRRWAIAWSFSDTHLPDTLARVSPSITGSHALYPVLPPRNTLAQQFTECANGTRVAKILEDTLRGIQKATMTEIRPLHAGEQSAGQGEGRGLQTVFFVETQENTWSRSARRGRRQIPSASAIDPPIASSDSSSDCRPLPVGTSMSLTARVFEPLRPSSQTTEVASTTKAGYEVEFQWFFGRDRRLFESFVSHICRKVSLAMKGGD